MKKKLIFLIFFFSSYCFSVYYGEYYQKLTTQLTQQLSYLESYAKRVNINPYDVGKTLVIVTSMYTFGRLCNKNISTKAINYIPKVILQAIATTSTSNSFIKKISLTANYIPCNETTCAGICSNCKKIKSYATLLPSLITLLARNSLRFIKEQRNKQILLFNQSKKIETKHLLVRGISEVHPFACDIVSSYIASKIIDNQYIKQHLKNSPFGCKNVNCNGLCNDCKLTHVTIKMILALAIKSSFALIIPYV